MSTSEPTLGRPVLRYFEGRCADWAVTALQAYCHGTRAEGRPLYTGACFEALAARDHPDAFTASDLVAVSMLSVTVPPRAAIRLLVDTEADALLRAIGPDRPIWETEESDLDDDSPASRLWEFLRSLEDIGPVTAGKLMAVKRPQLVPIYDQHVGAALGPPRRHFWLAMRRSMIDAHGAVESVVQSAGVAVTPLRAVDIVVWMHQHGWTDSAGTVPQPPAVD